jgi:dTDP-4-amino-4,6-dideoxygalactose transaminase
LQACFRDLGYSVGSFPNSERAGKEVLSIPVYPELTLEQKKVIVAAIVAFFNPRESQ